MIPNETLAAWEREAQCIRSSHGDWLITAIAEIRRLGAQTAALEAEIARLHVVHDHGHGAT